MKKTRLVSLVLSLMMTLLLICPGSAAAQERPTLELFVNHTWWPLQNWNGSVPEYISNQLGVDIKVTVASDSQQLPLMIAGETLPDHR